MSHVAPCGAKFSIHPPLFGCPATHLVPLASSASLLPPDQGREGAVIDYFAATSGKLQIAPEGAAREALAADYDNMRADDILVGDALPFDALMEACSSVAKSANTAAVGN